MCDCGGKHAHRKTDRAGVGTFWGMLRDMGTVDLAITDEDREAWIRRATAFLERNGNGRLKPDRPGSR